MILFQKTEKNVTLIFEVDKVSKHYLVKENCGNVIKDLSIDYFNTKFYRLLSLKKPISIIIQGIAISDVEKIELNKIQNKEVDYLIRKTGTLKGDSLMTMLQNKNF